MSDANTTQQTINDAISAVLAQSLVSNQNYYSSTIINNQVSTNSTGCKNININSSTVTYTADTTVFQDMDVYQKVVNNIVNSLSAAIDQTDDKLFGPFSDSQKAEINQLMETIITTTLTAQALDINNNSYATSVITNQVCSGSVGGVNVYVGTSDQIISYYTQSYSTVKAVQDVSNTIQNLADAQTTQKQSGPLAALLEMLAIMVVFVIVIIAVIIIAVAIGAVFVMKM